MQEKAQEYAKTTFDDVASRYDEIAFFKISARHLTDIIKAHKSKEDKGMLMELNDEDYERVKDEYYKEMFSHADMDGEVELIADTFFTVVKAEY